MTGKCLIKIIQQLLLIFCILKKKEIFRAYIPKHNSTREKQIIILMIPNEKKKGWPYPPVKKLSKLLR